ncbi:hypothetical protein D3C73_1468770 [compost metagenome]
MDVGDFLEFERTFHGHRELRAAAQEQCVVLLGEQLGDFLDGAVHGQGFAQTGWQTTQLFDQGGLDALCQGAANLAQGQGQQQQANQLGGECLG